MRENIKNTLAFLFHTQGVEKTVKEFRMLKEGIRPIKDIASKAGGVTRMGNAMQELGVDAGKVNIKLKRFKYEWLGIMFFSMAVKNAMNKLFKDMFTAFKKTTSGTNPLNKALTRLEASFTFLKVSILTAMGPLLIKFISWFAELAIAVAELDPDILLGIGVALGVIAGLATLANVAAQIALFASSLEMLGAGMAGVSAGKIKNLKKGLTGLVTVGVTIGFIVSAVKLLNEDGSTLFEDLTTIGSAALAGALIGSFFPGVGTLIGGVIGLAVGLTISIVDIFLEGYKILSFKDYMDAIYAAVPYLGLGAAGGISMIANLRLAILGKNEAIQDAKDAQEQINLSAIESAKKAAEEMKNAPNPFMINQDMSVRDDQSMKNLVEPVKELAKIATPQTITGLQKLYDDGVITELSTSVQEKMNPMMDLLHTKFKALTNVVQGIIDKWEGWKPSVKTLVTKHVTKRVNSTNKYSKDSTPYSTT